MGGGGGGKENVKNFGALRAQSRNIELERRARRKICISIFMLHLMAL